MANVKPTTFWAVVSPICSLLGCLVLPLLLTIDSSAGAGVSGGLALLFVCSVAGIFCLLGIIMGIVALGKVRGGEFAGRKYAWTGIVVGCMPFVALFVWVGPWWWCELMTRFGLD